MSSRYEEIKKFADDTLGELPQVIDLLFNLDEEIAVEQFDQNRLLYLGRKSLSIKTRILIAISVALANGPKESAFIHYKLAKKLGIDSLEIIDAMKVAKMVIMSSTLDTVNELINSYGSSAKSDDEINETISILKNVEKEAGEIPQRVKILSEFSIEFTKEHLREKKKMMKPTKLQSKDVYAIAFAVSASIRDRECQEVYLSQFIKNGGTREEAEDALATVRFISGNRVFVNGLEILKKLSNKK